MATQLNWRPDGGIVALVPEETLPEYALPSGATRIQLGGKPAFHVTLIGRRVMEPYRDQMETLWPAIASAATEPPVAHLSFKLIEAVDKKQGKKSWVAEVINADAYRKYLCALVILIDRHFETAGYRPFINPETDRPFHLTVANDKGGDPMYSVSDPGHSSEETMSFEALSPRFNSALTLAADLHRHQARKGTDIPYISHLLAVAAIALEFGADEDEAIAALLHDAVEDAPKDLGDDAAAVVRRLIEFQFGKQVRALVDACTDADRRDEHGNKPPWTKRKVDYVNAVACKSPSACLVAAADKLHNARAILRDFHTHNEELWCRFNKEAGRDGTLGYYRGLADAFASRAARLGDRRVQALTQELTTVVSELEGAVGMKGVWPPVRREA